MLFESVSYRDELPFSLSFLNIGEEDRHCHKEIEIVLVLRGITHYRIYHMDYELNPGDLIIADVEDLHQIHGSSDDILLLSLHIDTKKFESVYPDIRYMFFVCEECMDEPASGKQHLQAKLELLKHRIARLALDYYQEQRNPEKLMDGISDLLAILTEHFRGFSMENYRYKINENKLSEIDLQRLSRITRYILQHYDQKITLEDVAESEHLNSYYVSHLIKKTLGSGFQSFLNATRLEFAEKMLVFTNLTLMQISQQCGFSSPNYFNKCFSAWYGKTPAQYRKEYQPCERTYNDGFTRDEALELLLPYLNRSPEGKDAPGRITVSPEFRGQTFRPFWEHFAPKIRLSSMEDMMKLGYYEEELKRIRPQRFLVDSGLLARNKEAAGILQGIEARFQIPAEEKTRVKKRTAASGSMDAAGAFSHLLGKGECSLCGGETGLFTKDGLTAPLYHSYDFFAGLREPEISLYREYALVRSRDELAVVLFNTNPRAILDVRLETSGLPEKFFLMQTELTERENSSRIIDELDFRGELPQVLRRRINDAAKGRTRFSLIDKEKDPQPGVMVYHNTAVILEITGQGSGLFTERKAIKNEEGETKR